MIIGTAYFVSKRAAYRHYTGYAPQMTNAELRRYVNGKIDAGEIHIGPPSEGATVNAEGRYEVTVK